MSAGSYSLVPYYIAVLSSNLKILPPECPGVVLLIEPQRAGYLLELDLISTSDSPGEEAYFHLVDKKSCEVYKEVFPSSL